MNENTEKLAAALRDLQPSDDARTRGMSAAMDAFDAAFSAETANASQGSSAEPRPMAETHGPSGVRALGAKAMSNIRDFFTVTPRNAMMGGSCAAALIAALLVFRAEPGLYDFEQAVGTPQIVEAAELETPDVSKPVAMHAEEPASVSEPAAVVDPALSVKVETERVERSAKSPVESPVEVEAPLGTDSAPVLAETMPTVAPPPPTIERGSGGDAEARFYNPASIAKRPRLSTREKSASAAPSASSDAIVVTGSRAATGDAGTYVSGSHGLTAESGAFSSKTMSSPAPAAVAELSAAAPEFGGELRGESGEVRRVLKTPASTVERVVPAVTKTETRRIENPDGTYDTVTENIVVQEASTELVEVPPVYEDIRIPSGYTLKRVMKTPERTVERAVPHLGRNKTVRVQNEDGSWSTVTEVPSEPRVTMQTITIPAVYDYVLVPPKPKPQPEPQSGQLTAGDYDDVLNPDLYKLYTDRMLQGQLRGKDLPHIDANRRISVSVEDRLGRPVPLADITLTGADGSRMFPLKTGADGRAYLYPGYDGLERGTKIEASVNGRTVSRTISDTLIGAGGDMALTLNTRADAVQSMDLLLTIDATGSMSDEMRYLQTELQAILGRVEAAHPGIDIRTGLVVYRDVGDQYVVREVPFTDDLEAFQEQLMAQSAGGGGDTPEAMHTALSTGLDMDWRDDALKINLLVADAPPHDRHIDETWDAALLSRTRGIHMVPLAASGVDKTAEFVMRGMAQITAGRYLFLTDDSGIGNPHAEPTVDCYVVTRLDGLVTRVFSSLIGGERVEPRPGEVIRSVGNYDAGVCDVSEQPVRTVSQQQR